jgi:hypothetical protein
LFSIKAIVQDEKQLGSFAEAWAPFNKNHFEPLKRFFGGLATVFPGTASDESHYFVDWEKDDYRTNLTDLQTML